jgi:hypothetical protein
MKSPNPDIGNFEKQGTVRELQAIGVTASSVRWGLGIQHAYDLELQQLIEQRVPGDLRNQIAFGRFDVDPSDFRQRPFAARQCSEAANPRRATGLE